MWLRGLKVSFCAVWMDECDARNVARASKQEDGLEIWWEILVDESLGSCPDIAYLDTLALGIRELKAEVARRCWGWSRERFSRWTVDLVSKWR